MSGVLITMQGQLEPIEIAEDFRTAAERLNNAAMQGKEFLVATTPDGDNILVNIGGIICAIEGET